MPEEPARVAKRQRREQRRRAARRRVRMRRIGITVAVVVAPGLLVLECSGAEELVEGEVTSTRRWRHFAADGTSHPHTSAKLLIEGLSEGTVERADDYERGQRVPVWIQRGRISGWPYFIDVAKPGEVERERGSAGQGALSGSSSSASQA
jgi:hypothetical protein